MISPTLRVYLVYFVVFACDISNITSVSRLFSRVRVWYLQYYECISFILSCSHVISPILRVYLVYLVVFACDISNITSVSRLFSRVRVWYLQHYECISFILSCSRVSSLILRVYLVYLVVFACDISNITSVSRLFCRVRMWYLQYYECISFILSCSHVTHLQYYECIWFI